MADGTLHVKIVWTDPKAIKALKLLYRVLDSAGDDMAWRPELKQAAKAARYLAKHVKVAHG